MKEERLVQNERVSLESIRETDSDMDQDVIPQPPSTKFLNEDTEDEGLDKVLSSIRQIMTEEDKNQSVRPELANVTDAIKKQEDLAYQSNAKEHIDKIVDLKLSQDSEFLNDSANKHQAKIKQEVDKNQVTDLYNSVDSVKISDKEALIDEEVVSLCDDMDVNEKITDIIQQNEFFKELLGALINPVIDKVLEKWLAENGTQLFKKVLKDKVNSIIKKSLED